MRLKFNSFHSAILAILAILVLAESVLAYDQRKGYQSNGTEIKSERQALANVDCDRRESTRSRNRLPVLKSGRNSNEKFYVEASESFLHSGQVDSMSKSEYTRNMLIALAQSAVYSGIYQHRYETYNEMRLAQGPQVDEQKCLRQLEMMASRVRRMKNEGFESSDGNLYHILDTWGREVPGHLRAHLFLEGVYEDCSQARLRLDSPDGDEGDGTTPMRYCVMKFKHTSWGQLDRHDIIGMSMGICIPKSCGSANAGNKFELIGEIATRHSTPAERNQTLVSGLYCLPDEDSPARSILRSPKSVLVLVCLCSWIGFLLYATYKYDKLTERLKQKPAGQRLSDSEQTQLALFKKLSIRNNLTSLLSVKGSEKEKGKAKEEARKGSADCEQIEEEQLDLSCIEGIKVIAMCYIIMGHVLMCVPTIMNNGRQLADQGVFSVAFLIANLLPAFAVNTFFAITGLLTGYLVFKQNEQQRRSFITSPAKWAAFTLFRYLRIMPMYALAVLYCKTLARYTGSGPFWDYGTSALSQRRTCQHEHWAWTLTFSSNFLSPLEHCIPGGWYLANDFQFALVTPLYVALLYARPKLGQLLLYASIVASYVWGYASIYNSHLDNFVPIANFSPSGFKTYVSHLGFNYTQPQYRIPAFLIGLLAGYKIFNLEQQRQAFNRQQQLAPPDERAPQKPTWSASFRKYGAYAISWLIFNISLAPFFGILFPFCAQTSRVMASWANPALHLHFAAGITHFIMLAATGDANRPLARFLSAPNWRPLARTSLSCLLFNVEIINFIIQRQTNQMNVSNGSLMLLNLACILACFAVAALLTCLFESPIRLALNALIAKAMERTSAKQAASADQVRSRAASHHEKSA